MIKYKSKYKSIDQLGRKDKYYYMVKSDQLTDNIIDKIFKKRGTIWEKFNEKHPQVKYPDFIHVDFLSVRIKEIWSYNVTLKNMVDDTKKSIGRKNNLYLNLIKQLDKTNDIMLRKNILTQYPFDWRQIYRDNKIDANLEKIKELFDMIKIWIYKPVAGWKGMGIERFTSYDEFKLFFDNYLKMKLK